MSAGDENRAPEPVALLEDARKRKHRKPSRSRATPAPGGQTGGDAVDERQSAYSNADFLDRLGAARTPDEILNGLDAGARERSDVQETGTPRHTASQRDASDPGRAETRRPLPADDAVREVIERHHQRRANTGDAYPPRGSADLSPARAGGESRRARARRAPRNSRPRHRTAFVALLATGLVVIATGAGIAALAGSSHQPRSGPSLDQAAISRTGDYGSTTSALRDSHIAPLQKALHAEIASSTAAAGARPVVRRPSRKHAAPKRRTGRRPAPLARQQDSASHATSPPASGLVVVTTPVPTHISEPVSESAHASGGSSSNSRASSLPAGPTGPGSAGSNCNPKCS
jgi:hypothetical protein